MRFSCFAFGCTEPRQPKHLMCSAHWSRVPPDLKAEVYDKNRAKNAATGKAKATAEREWLKAAIAARAAVEE